MWQIEGTDDYSRDHKRWQKKHRDELLAVLANLEKFFAALNEGARPASIRAGFIHPEPAGVLALDQSGAKRKLRASRLYVYPHERSETLYLLRLGDKQSQPEDIQACKAFVSALLLQEQGPQDVGEEPLP